MRCSTRCAMRNLRLAPFPRFVLISCFAFAIASPALNGGMIDLLRGDEPTTQSFQRVAFVGSALVKAVDGSAERLVGIDQWKPLKPGIALTPGDLIRTRQGTVLLRMNESESFVRVSPNTILRLAEVEKAWDRSVLSGREEKNGYIVRGCRGKAFARHSTDTWQPIEVNSVLLSGSEVRTEAGTILDLFDNEAKRPLRIPGSTELTLNRKLLPLGILIQPKLAVVRGH